MIMRVSGMILAAAVLNAAGLRAAAPIRLDPPAATLLRNAQSAFRAGDLGLALGWATKAVQSEPENRQARYVRGQIYEAAQQPENAVADYTAVLEQDPKAIDFYQFRGTAQFKLGKIKESIADFDTYLEARPERMPQHWQRGISYYYDERYADGRRQFEAHQTVNDSDVENAVWHFLCVARSDGIEKARSLWIDVKPDSRVPMEEVRRLFEGKGTPDAVLKAAEAGDPAPGELKQRMFYAHLYLGLYHEATGDVEAAKAHMKKAAGPYAVPHYMGDVARVHLKLRNWQ